MAWVRLDDRFPDNPKVDGLTDGAFRTYVSALCHCSRNLTDGVLTVAAVRKLGGPRRFAELVNAGLLEQCAGGSHIGGAFEEEPERAPEFWDSLCSNPACPEQATIEYRRAHHYCNEGHIHDAEWRVQHVRFCEKHKRRGDCAFEDADSNLVVVALRKPDGAWQPIEVTAL